MRQPSFFRARPARNSAKKAKSFQFESLETREMMAANVLASPVQATPMTYFGTVQAASLPPVTTTPGGNVPTPGQTLAWPVPELSSLPGAAATIYLDFDGHDSFETTTKSRWIATPAFHLEFTNPALNQGNDAAHIVPAEQDAIRGIWAHVAEDFSPFNLNVTTVKPPQSAFDAGKVLRVTFGGVDVEGVNGVAGRAAINAFTDPKVNHIARIFPQKVDGTFFSVHNIASAASHEIGHAFGLEHLSATTEDKTVSGVQAIMRPDTGNLANRAIWWGNEVNVIASQKNGFGLRPDDHSNSIVNASPLRTAGAVIDPATGLPQSTAVALGVINHATEKDTFKFATGGGRVSIRLDLPQGLTGGNFHTVAQLKPVGNLHSILTLLDANGKQLAIDNDAHQPAGAIDVDLPAGNYFVQVASFGRPGDIGQYQLRVSESTGARVVAAEYQALSATQGGIYVTFNEAIDANTFTVKDVSINGGALGVGVLAVEAVAGNPAKFLIKINKPAANATKLSVSVGSQINDFFGNAMDQNQNRLNGEAVDAYMSTFAFAAPTPGPTTPTTPPAKTKTTAKKK